MFQQPPQKGAEEGDEEAEEEEVMWLFGC